MKRFPAYRPAQPFGEINTTPLIDVLLVLLVMFIITIPIQTHAVKLYLPAPSTVPPPASRTANLLTIGADATLGWNGTPIDRTTLRATLAATRQMDPAPELHLRPDPDARHGDVDALLGLIKREQITKVGFVGYERYGCIF